MNIQKKEQNLQPLKTKTKTFNLQEQKKTPLTSLRTKTRTFDLQKKTKAFNFFKNNNKNLQPPKAKKKNLQPL